MLIVSIDLYVQFHLLLLLEFLFLLGVLKINFNFSLDDHNNNGFRSYSVLSSEQV